MRWLVGYVIASMVGSFLIVRIVEYLFGGVVHGMAAGIAKASLFVTTWTAITAGLGMHAFTTRVGQLRRIVGQGGNSPDTLGLTHKTGRRRT
mgnify:CR=1 FL=1